MAFISVCKNIIARNNKNDWREPEPAIRVSSTQAGKVTIRSNHVGITDSEGNIVAAIKATEDGRPIIKCGAKVALITEFDPVDLQN